ncbi:hypothetical protein NLJ89_g7836 [Agrocybe chaxingu]|uniref:Zn(2)-C6 fungal-type domain-containing protein n=1 Tax=Agrocybe chaxingu TaxID=84603 RepID=A0A9W8MUN7_9AGAR|nr:hypothetical protein NLJ89_g7836 [Agrocybe chaxingu]
MASGVASLDYDHNSSPRPLKRARKSNANGEKHPSEKEEHLFVNNAPLDHIFIADGVTAKKSGGKKAPLSCCECRRLKLKCDRNFPCASCKRSQLNGPDAAKPYRSPASSSQHAEGGEQAGASVERGSSEDTVMAPDAHHHHQKDLKDDPLSEAHFAAEIVRLSHNFPLSDSVSPEPNLRLREYIRSNLPPREEADYLWEQARQNALWQYNPHPSSTFYPNLAYHCYSSPSSSLSPRRLALLFMILAVGCLVDISGRAPDHPDAERYHRLARASLCEIPVMEETNVETITALFYEIWYLLVFSDKKKAAGYAWGLMGLTAKLAQSIGLHRNGGKSKVIPEELEKRRSLFWELLYLDARLSLSLGRPPSLSINHMDCPRPSYPPDEDCDISESLHHSPVLDAISQPNLNYDTVLELDTRIRDFSMPIPLRNKESRSRFVIIQRASLSTALEAVLLQLHRQFFTRAVSGPEEAFNRRHKYAPSVVAVFLSASRMIATVQELYNHQPHLTARILGYWSNAFSAAVSRLFPPSFQSSHLHPTPSSPISPHFIREAS